MHILYVVWYAVYTCVVHVLYTLRITYVSYVYAVVCYAITHNMVVLYDMMYRQYITSHITCVVLHDIYTLTYSSILYTLVRCIGVLLHSTQYICKYVLLHALVQTQQYRYYQQWYLLLLMSVTYTGIHIHVALYCTGYVATPFTHAIQCQRRDDVYPHLYCYLGCILYWVTWTRCLYQQQGTPCC